MNLFISNNDNKIKPVQAMLNALLVTVLLVVFFWHSLSQIGVQFDFTFISDMRVRLFDGFLMTVYLSVCSLVVSLVIGVLSAVCRSSKVIFLRYLSSAYVTFIRGTPLIMQIYLFFYIVGSAFGIDSRFVSGVLILSVFEGAYISEIIRGSLLSIENSQIEAAKAVGFTKSQTLTKVILPQLFARTLPALTGQFASIIKDSSLLSMISVIELAQTIKEISAINLNLFECYLVLGVLYLVLTIPVSFVSKSLERKFNYEN